MRREGGWGKLRALAVGVLLTVSLWADDWTLADISQWARRGTAEDIAALHTVATEGGPTLAGAALSALRTVPAPGALDALLRAWRFHDTGGDSSLARAALRELRSLFLERSARITGLLESSEQPEVRIAVLALLRTLGFASVAELTARALRDDGSAEVRRHAAGQLHGLDPAGALPVFLEQLGRETQSELRLYLYGVLETSPVYRERARRKALSDPDDEVRSAALAALAGERPAWALEQLWSELASSELEIRRRALAGLRQIGQPPDVDPLLAALAPLPAALAGELQSLLTSLGAARHVPTVVSAAVGAEHDAVALATLRAAAALAARHQAQPALRSALTPLFDSPRTALRAEAFAQLSSLRAGGLLDAGDSEAIAAGVESAEPSVRAAALGALTAHPVAALLPVAIGLLEDPGCESLAVQVLCASPDEAARALLARTLPEGSRARLLAARVYGLAPDVPGSFEALLRLLEAEPAARLAAAEALGTAGARAREPLRAALDDPWFRVRAAAARSLARGSWDDPEELVGALLARVPGAEPPELEALAAALRSLPSRAAVEAWLASGASADSRRPVRLLGLLDDPAHVPHLVGLLDDPALRVEAALALCRLGSREGDAVLRVLLRDRRPAARQDVVRALRCLQATAGESYGFDPFRPLEGANLEALEAWERWLGG